MNYSFIEFGWWIVCRMETVICMLYQEIKVNVTMKTKLSRTPILHVILNIWMSLPTQTWQTGFNFSSSEYLLFKCKILFTIVIPYSFIPIYKYILSLHQQDKFEYAFHELLLELKRSVAGCKWHFLWIFNQHYYITKVFTQSTIYIIWS